eukprot:6214820-Pleurochrysis_carterae.AAC.1
MVAKVHSSVALVALGSMGEGSSAVDANRCDDWDANVWRVRGQAACGGSAVCIVLKGEQGGDEKKREERSAGKGAGDGTGGGIERENKRCNGL